MCGEGIRFGRWGVFEPWPELFETSYIFFLSNFKHA